MRLRKERHFADGRRTCEVEDHLRLLEGQIIKRNLPEAEAALREIIHADPLNSGAFLLFSEVKALRGEISEAQASQFRGRQLQQLEDRAGMSHGLERYLSSREAMANPGRIFSIGPYRFSSLRNHRDSMTALGCSTDGSAFLKVFVGNSPEAESRFRRDVEVLKHLSENHCVTSPEVLGSGFLERQQVAGALSAQSETESGIDESGTCPYVLLRYARADRGGFGLADVMLAILEQRSFGVYHGRIALRHIRFDSVAGVCRLTGFHSAIDLEEPVERLSIPDFWDWCLQRELLQYPEQASRFLAGLDKESKRVFSGRRLSLAHSNLFSRQRIAGAPEPAVMPVDQSGVFLETSREPEICLSKVDFHSGERVLEVGCGTGLLSRYLAGRGCTVTSLDMHPEQIHGARLLNNLSGLDGKFLCLDLDFEEVSGSFETICLIASLHHFWNIDTVTGGLGSHRPGRILVEAGYSERGYKWLGRWFQKTTGWAFQDQESFVSWLEGRFSGYHLRDEPVATSGGRSLYVLERGAAS